MRRLHIDIRERTLTSFCQRISLPFMGRVTHWWTGRTLRGNILSIYRERGELEVRLNAEVIFHASQVRGLCSAGDLLKYFDLRLHVEEREEKAS